MASITLDRVSKVYPNGHAAVRDATLDIADGELVVLLGPSGSGKSTILRLIAGLETPTAGRILIDGQDVTHLAPPARDLAMVFQSYALYPHKNVRENLAFPLRVRHVAPAEVEARVQATAAVLGLDTLLDRKPAQLSGGQRQRVALGRAIVREPRAFLLDEPLSNLDPLLRLNTRAELAMLHRRLAATMVYVTHDQEEAMTLGSRVAVISGGRVEQLAPGLEIFRRPANVFVAGFVGSPPMNLWRGRAARAGRAVQLVAPAVSIALDAALSVAEDADLWLGVRPHDVDLVPAGEGDADGRVDVVEPLGAWTIVHLSVGSRAEARVRALVSAEVRVSLDDRIGIRLRREHVHLFDGRTGRRIEYGGHV